MRVSKPPLASRKSQPQQGRKDALLRVQAAAAGVGGGVCEPTHCCRMLAGMDAQRPHRGVRERLHRRRFPRICLADVLEDLQCRSASIQWLNEIQCSACASWSAEAPPLWPSSSRTPRRCRSLQGGASRIQDSEAPAGNWCTSRRSRGTLNAVERICAAGPTVPSAAFLRCRSLP